MWCDKGDKRLIRVAHCTNFRDFIGKREVCKGKKESHLKTRLMNI